MVSVILGNEDRLIGHFDIYMWGLLQD